MAKRNIIIKEDSTAIIQQIANLKQQLLTAERDKLNIETKINNFRLQLSKLEGQLDTTTLTNIQQINQNIETQAQQPEKTTPETNVKESIKEFFSLGDDSISQDDYDSLRHERDNYQKTLKNIKRIVTNYKQFSTPHTTLERLIHELETALPYMNESVWNRNTPRDIYFLVDQLTNSMEFYESADEFAQHISSQMEFDYDTLKQIYDDYWKMPAGERASIKFNWEDWLKRYGIGETKKENYKDILLEQEDNDIEYDDLEYEEENETMFFVKIIEDENEFIGKLYRMDEDSRWSEKVIQGESGTFGSKTYMSYLTKEDILDWLKGDYDRVKEISEEEMAEYLDSEVEDFYDKEEDEIQESQKTNEGYWDQVFDKGNLAALDTWNKTTSKDYKYTIEVPGGFTIETRSSDDFHKLQFLFNKYRIKYEKYEQKIEQELSVYKESEIPKHKIPALNESIQIGKVYYIDVGSLAPVKVKVVDIKNDIVYAKYLDIPYNRIEDFSMNDFKKMI